MIFNLALVLLRLSMSTFLILSNFQGLSTFAEQAIVINKVNNEEPNIPERKEGDSCLSVLVIKVIDGDTFWVDDGASQFKVRFIGIDAPETRNTKFKKKGFYAGEAKEYVSKLTLNKQVKLVWDIQRMDRYQRALAYVYLEDGTFLNANLVENGYAVVSTFPPNVKHVDLFLKLQYDAREKQYGLWSLPVQDLKE